MIGAGRWAAKEPQEARVDGMAAWRPWRPGRHGGKVIGAEGRMARRAASYWGNVGEP